MRMFMLLLILGLASCHADRQTANQTRSSKGISFSGYGKQFYVPDAFDMQGALVVRDVDLRKGGKRHQEIVAAVRNYLAGLENLNFSITLGGLNTRFKWQANNKSIEYYEFTSQVKIRCRNLDLMEDMQMDLIDLGMDTFGKVSIFTENLQDITNLSRDLALEDARSKADYVAKNLGWKSYRVIDLHLANSHNAFMAIGGSRSGGTIGRRSGGSDTVAYDHATSHSSYVDSNITIIVEPVL